MLFKAWFLRFGGNRSRCQYYLILYEKRFSVLCEKRQQQTMAGFSIITKTITSYDYLKKVTDFNISPKKREANANAKKKNTG